MSTFINFLYRYRYVIILIEAKETETEKLNIKTKDKINQQLRNFIISGEDKSMCI